MKPRLKLVPKALPSTRPFKTDYAGAWPGHAKTREGAIIAAVKHIVRDGYSRATITDEYSGNDVARVRLSSDRKRAVVEVIKPFKEMP